MKTTQKNKKAFSPTDTSVTLAVRKLLTPTDVRITKVLVAVASLLFACAVSGCELFPGTYPFALAYLSATGGLLTTVSALIGAILGAGAIGEVKVIYIAVYLLLFILRVAISLWLTEAPDKPGGQGLTAAEVWRRLREKSEGLLFENIRVRLAMSAISALFAGAWSVAEGGFLYYDLFGTLFSLFLTPLLTYLYWAAKEKRMRASLVREIGIFALVASLTLALHQLSGVPYSSALAESGIVTRGIAFDFGVLVTFAATMVTSIEYGVYRGVLCGVLCGAVMTPMYAPGFAMGAIVAGLFTSLSPSFSILFGGAITSAWAIYVGGLDGMVFAFPPIVVMCALLIPAYRFGFVRLPENLFPPIESVCSPGSSAAMAIASAEEMKRRVTGIAEGFRSVSALLTGISERIGRPGRIEMEEIVSSAFDYHCAICEKREECAEAIRAREREGTPTRRILAEKLLKNGSVSMQEIPAPLPEACESIGLILDEINLTACYQLTSTGVENQLSLTAADCAITGDLLDGLSKTEERIGKIDEDLSDRLAAIITGEDFWATSATVYGDRRKHIFVDGIDAKSARLGSDEFRKRLEEVVGCRLTQPEFHLDGATLSMELATKARFICADGFFSCPRHGNDSKGEPVIEVLDALPDGVCGDVITSFETDGRYYVILSDGMGSGREAALTSGVVVNIFERLVKSGADLESSLKILNQIVRAAGRECSATVDVAEIDLVSGEAKFIKSGAAPSFVLRDGSIFRLQSKTVPIGIIRALDAEMLRFEIEPGDTVVMVSDGAARSYEEVPWLLDMLAEDETVKGGNPREAAEKIVRAAVSHGSEDDTTAAVIRIREER